MLLATGIPPLHVLGRRPAIRVHQGSRPLCETPRLGRALESVSPDILLDLGAAGKKPGEQAVHVVQAIIPRPRHHHGISTAARISPGEDAVLHHTDVLMDLFIQEISPPTGSLRHHH